MSPPHFQDDAPKDGNVAAKAPQPLKISKDSHSPMKRPSPSPSPSSSSSSSSPSSMSSTSSSGPALISNNGSRGGPSRGPARQPVIIYTHSPKVIHTQPQDFMALVQKLTGLCRPEEDHDGQGPTQHRPKREPSSNDSEVDHKNNFKMPTISDETDSSSVITDENNSVNNVGDSHVINSSFFPPPIFEGAPPNLYMSSYPMFNPNSSADYLRSNQSSFYGNYGDRLFYGAPNIRNSFSPSPTLEMMMNEFREC